MFYYGELERIHRHLCESRDDLTSELGSLPDGELFCSDNNGYRKYYQRLPAIGNRKKERRYGIKSDRSLVSSLVRKNYVVKALEIIDHDINVISAALRDYVPIDENTVMEAFTSRYPELAGGIYRVSFDPEQWKGAFSRIEDYHPENLKQTAADGTRMRSKNEVYIASRLDHYGLIYRSDCPTGIPGLRRIPDFTILRMRDCKKIYWEHFGMMDVQEYRADNKRKLMEYEAAGIVPWDNLIVTYDTLEGGLRADLIEALIKGLLL